MAAIGRGLVVAIMALGSLLLGGCAEGDLSREAHPSALAGSRWRAVEINGRPTVVGSEPTAAFTSNGVSGETGCNFYEGAYRYDPSTGSIAISQTAMSAVGCGQPPRGEIEAAYLDALTRASSASVDSAGRLVLSGPGGEIRFTVDAAAGATRSHARIEWSARWSDGRASAGQPAA
jgi:heat shock protein HslJ